MNRYKLRYAAGIYWLLDMKQTGIDYKKPIPMNESGAFLWETLQNGKEREEMIRELCRKYHINEEEAGEDVDFFLAQLAQFGL